MKKSRILVLLLCLVVSSLALIGCTEATKNEKAYWFSKYETRFVKYDDATNSGQGNIEEAGNYWEMTVKKDCNITISIRNGSNSMYSSTYLFLNGKQIKADADVWYEFVYKDLSLKAGDKLVFHAFWINGLATDDTGFKMTVFNITDDTGTYPIDDIEEK